jgi:hypothetical protein
LGTKNSHIYLTRKISAAFGENLVAKPQEIPTGSRCAELMRLVEMPSAATMPVVKHVDHVAFEQA